MKAPTLKGERVRLVPLSQKHLEQLFAWWNDPAMLFLWQHKRRIQSFEEWAQKFERLLNGTIDTFLVILEEETGKPIGFVYSYNTNAIDWYTYLCTFVDGEHLSQGCGKEATALFLDYLMVYLPLRKVYAEVYEFNEVSLNATRSYGFEEEGFLRGHRWLDGRYWGMYILALTRDRWLTEVKIKVLGTDART